MHNEKKALYISSPDRVPSLPPPTPPPPPLMAVKSFQLSCFLPHVEPLFVLVACPYLAMVLRLFWIWSTHVHYK